jgi:hypothetical protein
MVMTPFLMPKEENDNYSLELDINGMDKLLGYLVAAGDFSQEGAADTQCRIPFLLQKES